MTNAKSALNSALTSFPVPLDLLTELDFSEYLLAWHAGGQRFESAWLHNDI